MFKVKFTKIKTNHSVMRTDVVNGETKNLPEVGKSFALFADPIEEGASFRCVNTSIILKMVESTPGNYLIKTESGSEYQIEVELN